MYGEETERFLKDMGISKGERRFFVKLLFTFLLFLSLGISKGERRFPGVVVIVVEANTL